MVRGNFGKGVTRVGTGVVIAGRGYNNMDHIDKKFLVLYYF